MKTILVCIDFSSATESVLRVATQLGQGLGAELVLLHVVNTPTNYLVYPNFDGAPPPKIYVDQAQEQLDTLTERERASGLSAQSKMLVGLSDREILTYAKQIAADAIVMGSHGHSALYAFVVGSTTGGVLKHASCPVMVVPPAAVMATNIRHEEPAREAVHRSSQDIDVIL